MVKEIFTLQTFFWERYFAWEKREDSLPSQEIFILPRAFTLIVKGKECL